MRRRRVLKICGEKHHGDQESDRQRLEYSNQANEGKLLLLEEGRNYFEDETGNILGVEHWLVCSLGNLLKTYFNASHSIKLFADVVGVGDNRLLV